MSTRVRFDVRQHPDEAADPTDPRGARHADPHLETGAWPGWTTGVEYRPSFTASVTLTVPR